MPKEMTLETIRATAADLSSQLARARSIEAAAVSDEAREALETATVALAKFETLRAGAEMHAFQSEWNRLLAERDAANEVCAQAAETVRLARVELKKVYWYNGAGSSF